MSEEEAKQMERDLVKKYKANNPKFGYNQTEGGDATNINLEKPVLQYSINGELVNQYRSRKEASRATGIRADSIGQSCMGTANSAGGFIWVDSPISKEEIIKRANAKTNHSKTNLEKAIKKISMEIEQYDVVTGEVIARFPSQRAAERATGIYQKNISDAIKRNGTSGGFGWRKV